MLVSKTPLVTRARVLELLDYNEDTGEMRWKVDVRHGQIKAGAIAGCYDGWGYRQIKIDGRLYQSHRLAWLIATGDWPAGEIDHRDEAKDNNRLANLRPAGLDQNRHNVSLTSKNTSGFKGVGWRKQRGKWQAQIQVRRKKKHLGYFDTVEAARAAYRRAAVEHFGEFANFGHGCHVVSPPLVPDINDTVHQLEAAD